MPEALIPTLWHAGLVLALGVVLWFRWRMWGGIVLGLAAAATALHFGVVRWPELFRLAKLVDLQRAELLVVLWTAYSLVMSTGRLSNQWWGAPLSGALMGELGAVLCMARHEGPGRGRLVAAALGGALIGRVGDPSLLVLEPDPWWPALIGVGTILLAQPWSVDIEDTPVSAPLLALGVMVWIMAWLLPVWSLGIGLVVALVIQHRHLRVTLLPPLVFTACGIGLALLAVLAGVAELAAMGLEDGQLRHPWVRPEAFAGVSALLALLGDPGASVLFVQGLMDRALSIVDPRYAQLGALGLAVGNVGPLLWARVFRAAWWAWLIQLGAAAALVWWM